MKTAADTLILRADRSHCPTLTDWYYLASTMRQQNHGDQGGEDMRKRLRKLAEENGSSVQYGEWKEIVDEVERDEFALFIQTPLMARVLKLVANAKDVNFMDSTASVDLINSTLTTIVTSSSVGVLPVGISIHSAQTTISYCRILKMAKKFGIGAKVYITDDCDSEQTAISPVYSSTMRISCRLYFLSYLI